MPDGRLFGLASHHIAVRTERRVGGLGLVHSHHYLPKLPSERRGRIWVVGVELNRLDAPCRHLADDGKLAADLAGG